LKGQMIAYYEEMATHILPFLKNKPISLNRFPNGIQGDSFFQKEVDPKKIPTWLKTVAVHAESTNQSIDYLVCNNKATLLYIANLGSIEINPWLSTYQKPDYPEFGVLDLDPNGADFQQVIMVAKCAKELFDKMEVPAFLKTSGSTGLHIYAPVNKQYTFVQVRDFFQLVAQWVHEQLPEITSVIRDPKKRKGLVYLDYLQNRRAQTVVAPYSLRPKPGATASAPLAWSELKEGLSIADFSIKTLLKRVKMGVDPWVDIWDKKANLKQAIRKF
ncbi:MAG: non-homologous end-joining DNA ligase, partial [Sphingobacterium sp.]